MSSMERSRPKDATLSEEIYYLDATDLAEKIRTRNLSPVEVINAFLERIEEANPKINAIVTLAEGVIEEARAAEDAVMRGEPLGPLHGVPFTIKDCIDTAGIRTTQGSKLFEDHVPTADATVVTRLKQAGGIFLAKTNMPEFALWWETDNLVFGRTKNPWNLERIPGGSSGGEAAALASGLSALGIGSDLGGSVRAPAHCCGVVGLKATHGRIPLTGHWPDTLLRTMHVGPMARTVRDVALALRAIAGPDGIDTYAVPVAMPMVPDAEGTLPRLRIGWSSERGFTPVSGDVQETVARAAACLEELGCKVDEVPLTFLEEHDPQAISMAAYTAESRSYLESTVSGRFDQLHPNMQRRMHIPMPTLNEYLKALDSWETIRQETASHFRRYDLLLCPSMPLPAYPHDQKQLTIGDQVVPSRHTLRATLPWNLTGSPAISIPFGWSSGHLPIGVQLVARHFDETTLLQAAMALEARSETKGHHPPV